MCEACWSCTCTDLRAEVERLRSWYRTCETHVMDLEDLTIPRLVERVGALEARIRRLEREQGVGVSGGS